MIGGDKIEWWSWRLRSFPALGDPKSASMSPLSGLVPKSLCRRNSLGAAPGHSRFWQNIVERLPDTCWQIQPEIIFKINDFFWNNTTQKKIKNHLLFKHLQTCCRNIDAFSSGPRPIVCFCWQTTALFSSESHRKIPPRHTSWHQTRSGPTQSSAPWHGYQALGPTASPGHTVVQPNRVRFKRCWWWDGWKAHLNRLLYRTKF